MAKKQLTYLVLPSIVRLDAVWNSSFHFLRESKEGLGELKLSIYLIHGDIMINETEEAHSLCRLQKLSCN